MILLKESSSTQVLLKKTSRRQLPPTFTRKPKEVRRKGKRNYDEMNADEADAELTNSESETPKAKKKERSRTTEKESKSTTGMLN